MNKIITDVYLFIFQSCEYKIQEGEKIIGFLTKIERIHDYCERIRFYLSRKNLMLVTSVSVADELENQLLYKILYCCNSFVMQKS